MIKTIIAGGIILSLIGTFLVPEIITIILQVKGSLMYYMSFVLSELAITVVFFEIAWGVFINLLRKI